jgi:hypothetical protein
LKGEGSTATLFSPAQISSQHPFYNFTISEQMPAPQLRVFPQQANSESLSLTRGIRLQCGLGIITKNKTGVRLFSSHWTPGQPSPRTAQSGM